MNDELNKEGYGLGIEADGLIISPDKRVHFSGYLKVVDKNEGVGVAIDFESEKPLICPMRKDDETCESCQ